MCSIHAWRTSIHALSGNRIMAAWILPAAVLLTCLPLFGQGNAGRDFGIVTDKSGGAISGATVTVTDVQRGVSRTLTTDSAGAYNAPELTPGTYSVIAAATGFSSVERRNILLEIGGEVSIDFALPIGERAEKVEVAEVSPLIETTNAELGGTLQSQIITELPLNGRNFLDLLELRPGVVRYPGFSSGWAISANGLRPHDNVYRVEGINIDDPFTALPMINATGIFGDAVTLLSVDSIEQMRVEANPRAEYGWKPGAVTNVVIKSGTDEYHGTGFAFGRDGALDARNYFASALPASDIPPVAVEQFGATFGGPIRKHKLFYFVSFEDQRYSIGNPAIIFTPVTAPGIGDSTTNLLLGCQAALDVGTPAQAAAGTAGALTALSAQIAGITVGTASAGHPNGTCVPGPNYPGLFPVNSGSNSTGFGITTIPNTLSSTSQTDFGLAKLTYHPNDENSFNAMYYISPGNAIVNDSPGFQTNAVWLTNQYGRSQAFAGNWTRTGNTPWVNELRVGYSHYYQVFQTVDHTEDPANYNFNGSTYHFYTGQTNPLYFGFPGLVIQPFSGPGGGWPKYIGPTGVLDLLDHVSYLRGKHSFKFGGEILDNRMTSNIVANVKGPIRFDQLQDFFNGFPNGPPGCNTCPGSGGTASIFVGNLLRHFNFQGYAAFLQDDWRVKPRLILNFGLRYELNTVPKERDDLQGNFAPDTPSGLAQVGLNELAPYNGDHHNFSPRIGFAWDIFGNGKTVLRGGGGIIYEQLSLDTAAIIGNSFD